MKRNFLGFSIAMMGLVFMCCTNPEIPAVPQAITLLAIPGVVAPVRGATPVTTAIDTVQYTGTITWSPVDNPFAATTAYTATIVLTAKTGWTLTGVAANSFTVAGATATNALNSGTVAAVFPATGSVIPPSDYNSANIGTLKGVPDGSFQRDATESNIITVSAFRMSQYEITRAQFLAIMGTDPSDATCSSGTSDPVQQVNWYHAIAFCNKLSLAEGLTPVYVVTGVNFTTLTYAEIPLTINVDWSAATATWTNTGYRLPSEMEWMWAAMGADRANPGATNSTGYMKAFAGSTGGNAIGDYAWYAVNSSSRTHQAGTKLPNELGLYDMSGNVWEYCWDWYGSYPSGVQTDPVGPSSGSGRVSRGGGWNCDASNCAVVNRLYSNPGSQFGNVGFRVARP